jgi:ATP-dependent Clp protease ATP-binding subunit ClpC
LEKIDLVKIVEIEVKKFGERLKERAITLEFSKEAKTLLIDKGYDEKYGARPLRRAVEHYLEDPLAEAIIRGTVKDGYPVRVVRKEGEEKLDFEQIESSEPASPATDTEVSS